MVQLNMNLNSFIPRARKAAIGTLISIDTMIFSWFDKYPAEWVNFQHFISKNEAQRILRQRFRIVPVDRYLLRSSPHDFEQKIYQDDLLKFFPFWREVQSELAVVYVLGGGEDILSWCNSLANSSFM